MWLALSKGVVLSQEDVSGENDEAAHGKCRVDADHYLRGPGLEDTCGEQRDTDQRCERNHSCGNDTEGGDAMIQPSWRAAQCKSEAA
jgi:hypothetical protein